MIYTVTGNPSLDLFLTVDGLQQGHTNRALSEEYKPGGKGINVSIVLKQMGIESVALGFLAGFTGRQIEESLRRTGIRTDFIMLPQGNSRINVKLKNLEGTEINGVGPAVSKEALALFFSRLEKMEAGDYLVLGGSVPAGMDQDIYLQVLRLAAKRGVPVIVDTSGDTLRSVLPEHPFLVKPNHHELGELFGVELTTREEVGPYAHRLIELGAQNVIVSLGGQGAIYVSDSGQVYETAAPEGRLVNAVGAGDSMVAGFLTGLVRGETSKQAFYRAVATGSATAFSENFATIEQVEELLSRY